MAQKATTTSINTLSSQTKLMLNNVTSDVNKASKKAEIKATKLEK